MWHQMVRIRRKAGDNSVPGADFRENALPMLQQMRGFAGVVMLRGIDNDLGATGIFWEDEASMRAAQAETEKRRADAAQRAGFTILETDEFEVVLVDRKQVGTAGSCVRSSEVTVDPAKIDAAVKIIREQTVPLARDVDGYLVAQVFANRKTGRIIATTAWATRDDMNRSSERMTQLRQEAVEAAGAPNPKVEEWEAVLVEIKTPAQTA